MQGARVQSLVGELKFHMLPGVAKENKLKKKKKKHFGYSYNVTSIYSLK